MTRLPPVELPDAELEPVIQRLGRDTSKAVLTLSDEQARFFVDYYYNCQKDRIRQGNRITALTASSEPHALMDWLASQSESLEKQVARILDYYSKTKPLGEWMREIAGIGPIISAGFLAHADPMKSPTPSALWRFAGLDPTCVWGKGQKRPWNASLKRLCFLLGESLVKINPETTAKNAQYTRIYAARKAAEIERNDAGWNKTTAETILASKNWRGDTATKACYESGKLPPNQLHMRAKRFAVKVFLVHYWQQARIIQNLPVLSPWAISHGGHTSYIAYGAPIGRWTIAAEGRLDYVAPSLTS